MTRRAAARILIVVAGAVLLVGCSGSGNSEGRRTPTGSSATSTSGAPSTTTAPPATTTPPTTTTTVVSFGTGATLDEAVAAYIRTLRGSPGYAGDCATTELPRDQGKWCRAQVTEAGARATVTIGPVFSEVAERLTVDHIGASWVVTAHEPAPRPGG